MTRADNPGPTDGQGTRLLSGSLAQQVAQATGLLALLVLTAVLARNLSLSEFGAYGLLASLARYLLILQRSVANAAVRAIAEAPGDHERQVVFSTAMTLYAAAGVVSALLIAGAGTLISAVILTGELRHEGYLGTITLAVVTGCSLVMVAYLDALRGSLLYLHAAATDIIASVVYCALMLGLVAADVSLWIIIGASGALPLIGGLVSALMIRVMRLSLRFKITRFSPSRAREILTTARHLMLLELSTLVIYGFDRVLLGAFRSPATVGLYEGPIRAHNLFHGISAALTATTLPAASRYFAVSDQQRLRGLVVRGSRYSLAFTVPFAVVLMVLAAPVLDVWLGDAFREGATTLVVLVSYWLLYEMTLVTPGVLVGAGKSQWIGRCFAVIALANVVLSLALTPELGLLGPALGTAIPFVIAFPFIVRVVVALVDTTVQTLVREAWVPAYSLGLVLALALAAARYAVGVEGPASVLVTSIAGVLLYWGAFYVIWLTPAERRLFGKAIATILHRRPRRIEAGHQ